MGHATLYYLIRSTFNATFSGSQYEHRLKEELKTCAKAELILPRLNTRDWRGTAPQYVDKVVFPAISNLVPYDGGKLEAAKLHLDSGHINVLYLGTLYDGVRTPDAC